MFHCSVIKVLIFSVVVSTAFRWYHRSLNLSRTFFQVFLNQFSVKRRRRDLNPCAAINDLLPFQGSPFGQLGYFSKLPYLLSSACSNIYRKFVRWAERVGFEPTRPCGQTVFKTASLWPLRYLSRSVLFCCFSSAHLVWYQYFSFLSTGNFTFFQKSFHNGENGRIYAFSAFKNASPTSRSSGVVILIFR